MQHVAIDLGSSKSQVCVRNADGSVAWERSINTKDLVGRLQKMERSRVVMETCAESFRIADGALAAGHEVRVVPATLVRQLGVGDRGIKTDRRDAQALSSASCRIDLPSVHLRSEQARERLTRIGVRQGLVEARTKLINTVRGWMRSQLRNVRCNTEHFGEQVREALLTEPEGVPDFIDGMLTCIKTLSEQISKQTDAIRTLTEQDEVCKRLMTVPGVGPITSMTFVGVIDDVSRFKKAEQLESYLGLTPGERSSSKRVRRTGITKAGSAMARHVLTQAALTLRRVRRDDPLTQWAEGIKQRRGAQVATIAVARKLAGIMFAMWRDKTSYNPNLAATKPNKDDVMA